MVQIFDNCEWSDMVWACVEEGDGHVLRKALESEVKGKRK